MNSDLDMLFAPGPNGDVGLRVGIDEIVNRLKFILTTPRGAIPMSPEHGSPLSVFGTTGYSEDVLESVVNETIQQLVPEAKLDRVQVEMDGHKAKVSVFVIIRGQSRQVTL